MLPYADAHWLLEAAGHRGKQSVAGDEQRSAALAGRVAPAFRFAVAYLACVSAWPRRASSCHKRTPLGRERPQANATGPQLGAEHHLLIPSQFRATKPSQQLRCADRLTMSKQDTHHIGWHARAAGEQLERRPTGGSDTRPCP